jgi:predicted nuclease of predicted toxin-antitoxin system
VVNLYADEQFPKVVSELLRTYGHEVLTVQEAGNANLGIPDEAVLKFAVEIQRAIVTLNRNDFAKLHRKSSQHFGILLCSNDPDRSAMTERIHLAIVAAEPLSGKLIRVSRPG